MIEVFQSKQHALGRCHKTFPPCGFPKDNYKIPHWLSEHKGSWQTHSLQFYFLALSPPLLFIIVAAKMAAISLKGMSLRSLYI